MNAVLKVAALGFAQLVAIGLLVFLPAGTFDYWQAWAFLAVFALTAWFPSIYLQITNPVVLERRMRSGPIAEGRTVQKIVMLGLYGSLVAVCVVSGLDHRFGWSSVPAALCVIGNVAGGCRPGRDGVGGRSEHLCVHHRPGGDGPEGRQHRAVRAGAAPHVHRQRTDPGRPAACPRVILGARFVMPGVAVLAARIHDEEKLLGDELDGYREYTQKVRSRLIPYMW